LIAKRLIEIANELAPIISHGATARQRPVRFELRLCAERPRQLIAPGAMGSVHAKLWITPRNHDIRSNATARKSLPIR